MNGEIFFNMLEQQHPISGSSKYLLKRWRKHTIYSKSGSYTRGNGPRAGLYPTMSGITTQWVPFVDTSCNPTTDLYQTNSIYLYDYVVVTDKFFYDSVYTAFTIDTTPNLDGDILNTNYVPINKWKHQPNTWKNSPDAITNNYVWRYNANASTWLGRSAWGTTPKEEYTSPDPNYNILMATPIYRDDGTFFEIVRGYPRNHYTHKRHLFSLFSMRTYGMVNHSITYGSYVRNRQTITSTVGQDGLEDGSAPVQSVQVGNLKLVQTDNVINH
jgi:hypothetical protein